MARGLLAEKNRKRFLRNKQDPRHGTSNGYGNLGCRCRRCKSAWADAHLKYMHNNPIQRRKQADRNLKYLGKKRQTPYFERRHAWRDV